MRKVKRLEAALPWLYLKEVAKGQLQQTLEVLVGSEAKSVFSTGDIIDSHGTQIIIADGDVNAAMGAIEYLVTRY